MKYLVVILAFLALLGWSQRGTAQEPPPDFGETNLLLLACQYLTDSATSQSVVVKYCRRAAPDEINGYEAKIHVNLATYGSGKFNLTILFRKSLWNISTVVDTP